MKRWLLVALLLVVGASVGSARWYEVGPLHLDPPKHLTADERTIYDLAQGAVERGSAWGTPKLAGGFYVITDFASYRKVPPEVYSDSLHPAPDDRIVVVVVGGELWPARRMAAASAKPMPTTRITVHYDLTLGVALWGQLSTGRPFTAEDGHHLERWGTPVALRVSRD